MPFRRIRNRTGGIWRKVLGTKTFRLTPLGIVIIGLAVSAFLFMIVSAASPYWYKSKDIRSIHGGLWRRCSRGPSTLVDEKICFDFENTPDWLKACQALMIISILSHLLVPIAFIFVIRRKKAMKLIGGSMLIPSVLCLLTVCIYTDKNNVVYTELSITYNFSYILAWLGTLLDAVGCVIGMSAQVVIFDNQM